MNNFTKTIVTTLVGLCYLPVTASAAGSNGVPSRLNNLEEVVGIISSELDTISNQIVDLEEIRLSIDSLSEKITELDALKLSVDSNSSRIAELESLKESISSILSRVEELENLNETVSTIAARVTEIEGLKDVVSSISSRVSILENVVVRVDSLTNQLNSLENVILQLETKLSDFTHCNSLGKLYSPNDVTADSDGCTLINSGSNELNATVLHSETASYYSSFRTASIDLNSITGNRNHVRVVASCQSLGSDSFNSTVIQFLGAESESILSIKACDNRGVSNGESSGYKNDFIMPIPNGTASIKLTTRALRNPQGGSHSESVITAYVLGSKA
ncbi:hypothetical protein [Alteromonas sp. a30]|uniref:hypothetical protein n=1 Tax=Alteromonas sp. a30 TaxID=2730917 RepID=UPI00227FAE0D|nr:hypothetical protein [Alteromonas sp. a30]MCY7297429.1 hypothetical protein [Alteromonas sp. a30]